MESVLPEWPAPARVKALVTTRAFGDIAAEPGKAKLRPLLPQEPVWLKQVHGTVVIDADAKPKRPAADAAVARTPGTVCAVMLADCMPVLLTDEAGSVVAAAHAGWRGLSAGVIEAALGAMQVPAANVIAWLGPAIGPRVYEVGDEVRAVFSGYEEAFSANRPGHWLLDLYAVARKRLAQRGVKRVYGGGLCTYSDAARFFSYRRDRGTERMAAVIWLA